MASRYWVGGTGNWDASTTTHWSATSGGAGGQSVPSGSSDFAFLDANSGGGTVTMTSAVSVNQLIMSDFTGTLNTNGQTVNCSGNFWVSGTGVRTLNLGASTLNLSGTSTSAWYALTTTNLTFNAGTSTIKLTGAGPVTFDGGGKVYNNLWISKGANTSAITIAGSNTFNDFKDDSTAAHSIRFTAGTTQTVSTFTVSGTAGNLITIDSTTTGTHTLSQASGTVNSNYLNVQHSIATGGATWNAGANSINNQATATSGSGWIFPTPPVISPFPSFIQS